MKIMREGLGAFAAVGIVVAASASIVLSAGPADAVTTTLPACAISFIGVPGSGQGGGYSSEMTAIGVSLTQAANAAGQRLRSDVTINYPAISWYKYAIPWGGLGTSEYAGEQTLLSQISADRAANSAAGCPDAPIAVAGYSQGAEVAIRAVDALSASVRKTVTIALIGNPSFQANNIGALELQPRTYDGIRPAFTTQTYSLTRDMNGRVIDVCANGDPICGYTIQDFPGLITGSSAHYHYMTLQYKGLSLTHNAGNFLWSKRYQATPTGGGATGGGGTGGGRTGGGSTPTAGSISIDWSSAYPSWIAMTASGFSAGTWTYTCHFNSGGDASYTVSLGAGTQTLDDGHTCYDTMAGDTVWVTISSATSNTISVATPVQTVFPVMNTSESPPDGVWFRNSPHTADTDRVTGDGIYAGDQVQLQCYGWGDSVGQYNDTLWYYVHDLTRPTVPGSGAANQGWLSAHYINDGKNANVVDAGVPAC